MAKILIVGASSGIGLATAKRYAERGDQVTNVSRRDCEDARVFTYRADMSVKEERERAVAYLGEHDRLPDVFIYSAGASMCAPAEYIEEAHLRYLWEVNYFAPVHLTQILLAHLSAVHGKLVYVGSMASVAPIPFDAHYSASKAALNAFACVLVQEVKPYDVAVSVVLPGGTATGFSFKRLIYDREGCGKYYAESQKAQYTLGKLEQTGMHPDRAAALIQRHVDKNMELYYPVGATNALTYLTCKVLPQPVLGATIRAVYATDKLE